MENELLTVEEAALYLQLNEQTVRAMARDGRLPAFKVGRAWRFAKVNLNPAQFNQVVTDATQLLVIDDDPLVHGLLEGSLRLYQPRIHYALTGEDGLKLLEDQTMDLIFLDLSLPGMQGPETLGRIREMKGQIPVVIVTSYPDSKLMEEALRYGPLVLLSKPILPDQVLNCYDTLLGINNG